ncbi:hypothetical protein Tco_0268956 [Tanacetum coccineum]
MKLYIRGNEHGKDLIDSVLIGPLKYGTGNYPTWKSYGEECSRATVIGALKSGAVLKEEHMDFLADNGNAVTTGQGSQEVTTPISFQTNNLDAFDSNCDEAPSASAILMAKLFAYQYDVLSKVPSHDNYLNNDMFENNVQELQYSEQPPFIDDFNIESTSDSNVISYDQHLKEYENEVVQGTTSPDQQDALIMFVIEEMSNQVK